MQSRTSEAAGRTYGSKGLFFQIYEILIFPHPARFWRAPLRPPAACLAVRQGRAGTGREEGNFPSFQEGCLP